MSARVIPGWTAVTPGCVPTPPTWRDYWDAFFGIRRRYFKVEHDGSWFICRPHEIFDLVEPMENGDRYIISEVRMTRRQFEALPEFEGF